MRMRLPILALACAGFGALLLSGAASREEVPAPLPPMLPGAGAAPPAVAPLPEAARGPWEEQVARPLFAQSRRPPPPPAPPQRAAPPPAPEPPPPSAATGIVIAAEEGAGLALLRLADGGHARAREGEEIGGWRVARISAEGVELTRGARRVTLAAARAPSAPGLQRID